MMMYQQCEHSFRDEEFDRISSLRVGADDDITKDIGINYLIVRIEALFNRRQALNLYDDCDNGTFGNKQTYGIGIRTVTHACILEGRTDQSYSNAILDIDELASNAGEIKDYNKLMRAAKICVEPNTISAHIKTIRDRMQSVDAAFNCIKTERGAGYRWVEA